MSMIQMFGVIVPSCLIMTVLYIRIYIIFKETVRIWSLLNNSRSLVFQMNRMTTAEEAHHKTPEKKSREIKTTIVLIITVVFFVICWCPLYIVDIISYFFPNCMSVSVEVINAMIIMRHVNSVLNPFLYSYHMKGFRQSAKHALAKIFCCRKTRRSDWSVKNTSPSTTTTTF